MTKIIISGYKGKMGARILALAQEDKALEVAGKVEADDDLSKVLSAGDVLIEFTTPEATMEHLRLSKRAKKAMVIGTTGLSEAQLEEIKDASKAIPILFSPNMSVGVNVLFDIAADVAKRLREGYEVEIVEAHHKFKKDAPSGTAKKLAEIISGATGRKDIPVHSIRAGDIVGDHTVIFAGNGERIELTHRAQSRDTFALGALAAAKFIANRSPGLYSMEDVLL